MQKDEANAALLVRVESLFFVGRRGKKILLNTLEGAFNNCASTQVCVEMVDRAANLASMICAILRQCID
jgi:hypothetical protein